MILNTKTREKDQLEEVKFTSFKDLKESIEFTKPAQETMPAVQYPTFRTQDKDDVPPSTVGTRFYRGKEETKVDNSSE